VAVLATTFASGCNRIDLDPVTRDPALPELAAPIEPVLDVEISVVRRGAISTRISVPGSLVARRESQISARVPGRIERVFVSEGDRLQAGAPLFQIERAAYEAARLRNAAGLDLAIAERRQVESDLGRARTLVEKGILPQQRADRLDTELAVAIARERQAEQALSLAQRDLEDTLVRAPYAGSISKRLADEGTTATSQPQTVVVVLQEIGVLEVLSAIAEGNRTEVRTGDRVRLHIPGERTPRETVISSVSDTLDPATRTYDIRMEFPNPDHRFKAGVFLHVEIIPSAKPNVVLVPREAVHSEAGRTHVFILREGRAVSVNVLVGMVTATEAEILHGLLPGEKIVAGDSASIVSSNMLIRATPTIHPPGNETANRNANQNENTAS